MTFAHRFDYVIVGGGLQGCLSAHALAWHRPEAAVLLVEQAAELCGNHTWSFHDTDVDEPARAWFDTLVVHRWPGYNVAFPGLSRRVRIPYATITSDRLRDATMALSRTPAGAGRLVVRAGEPCEIVSSTAVRFGRGDEVPCSVVLDCRGLRASSERAARAGYQTFIGQEYRTVGRWPASEPTVMDVPDDQTCGFEFLYELPLGPHRVLLEYTRFHEEPTCDPERARSLIARRLSESKAGSATLIRTERGCLPMPYGRESRAAAARPTGGYAGGWYHAATGYSLPLAVRFAELVARSHPEHVAAAVRAAANADGARRGFCRFLNRLLFCLVRAEDRWKIFRRFYRVLPEDRIARFYAHRFTGVDAARILLGRPPTGLVPLRFARSFVSPMGSAAT